MDITIGMMDRRVKFESPTKAADGSGGQIETYEQWLETWAFVKPINGFRNFSEGYSAAATRYDIWVWWRQDLSSNIMKESKIIYENRPCTIDSMLPEVNGKLKYFHFTVTEKH